MERIGGLITLPNERTNALLRTRQFLLDMYDPKKRPKTVGELKLRLRSCLKHYPGTWEIRQLAEQCPGILGELPEEEDPCL